MTSTERKVAQAQIKILGAGLSLPGSPVGMNAGTTAYITLRANVGASDFTYGVASFLDANGNSGALVVGYAATEWFYISDEAYNALRLSNLRGKGYKIDIQVKGTLLGSGKSDIDVMLIGEQNNGRKIIEAYDVKSSGAQISGTSVRGQLHAMPGVKASAEPN
ncbi:MAG: hypothetical protein HLX50_16395 [Alteromonadaceae bacterium]|nr:hypothetical protein [Alteromonadaceae bacterium]